MAHTHRIRGQGRNRERQGEEKRDGGGDSIRDTERGKGRETKTRDGRLGPAREAGKDRITVRERRQGEELGEGQSWWRGACDHPGSRPAVKGLTGMGSQSIRWADLRCPTVQTPSLPTPLPPSPCSCTTVPSTTDFPLVSPLYSFSFP